MLAEPSVPLPNSYKIELCCSLLFVEFVGLNLAMKIYFKGSFSPAGQIAVFSVLYRDGYLNHLRWPMAAPPLNMLAPLAYPALMTSL